jgi:hypothetical protein
MAGRNGHVPGIVHHHPVRRLHPRGEVAAVSIAREPNRLALQPLGRDQGRPNPQNGSRIRSPGAE